MTAINRRFIVTAAVALAAAALVSGGAMLQQPAFAHSHTALTVAEGPAAGKQISIVLGHTNEPAFGARTGLHDGRHDLEVMITDAATKLPLAGAALKADKYYFRDIQSFNRAALPDNADEVARGVSVAAVFGDAGHYTARQVQKPGIYGYRLYGNVSYFGVAQVPIDATVFCSSPSADTSKFNTAGWSGAFGCTQSFGDMAFPQKNFKPSASQSATAASPPTATTAKASLGQSNSGGQGIEPLSTSSWLLGIPLAAAAVTVVGWKKFRKG
jgi:hypothetical protein